MAEVFFDQKEVANSADIVRYRFRAEPVPGCRSVHSYTLWLNLEADPQQLLGKMSRNTRAQIRRARADGLRYEFASAPTESWAEQFFDFFDSFAKDRHLTPIYRVSSPCSGRTR